MGKGLYINDSIHGLISLSEFEKRIISSMEFNRLHDVYQNSTVYLTFPSNRTKRFEHSVGTMTLCSKMFYCAIQNSDYDILDSFYKAIQEEVKAIFQDIAHDFRNSYLNSKLLKVPNPEKEPLIPAVTKDDTFRNSLVPYKVEDNFKDLHLLLIQSVRVAALLHDIGHPPFSHVVENSLKKAYKENIEKIDKNSNTQTFINTLGRYIGPDAMGELHEQIGKEISTSILCDIIPYNKDVTYDDNENLFEILVFKTVDKILSNEGLIGILHTIIDGSLDGDRLDYVTRDSLNSGLDVGKIDYKRIINEMQIRYVSIEDKKFSFCFPYKALSSVEDFLKRRYNGYKDIIFHHRAIKTDFLLGETVKQLIQIFLEQSSSEFTHNEENCMNHISDIIPYNISGLWFPLKGNDASSVECSNALSQWNDSWLITILKQEYYSKYYKISSDSLKLNILSIQLEELLCNTKKYYSLIKRSEDFMILDSEALTALNKHKKNLLEKIEELENLESTKNGKPGSQKKIGINPTLDLIKRYLKDNISQNNETNKFGTIESREFFLPIILSAPHYQAIDKNIENNLRTVIVNSLEMELKQNGFLDCKIVFKHISLGLNPPIYFYKQEIKDELYSIFDISGISQVLFTESCFFPNIYIYLLLDEANKVKKLDWKEILKFVGSVIGNELSKAIEQMVDKFYDLSSRSEENV